MCSCTPDGRNRASTISPLPTAPRDPHWIVPVPSGVTQTGEKLLEGDGPWIYEQLYCERGNAENRIKQMTLDLQCDRTSTHWMSSNQLRLWLSAFAYLVLERLRILGLQGTEMERSTMGQIRLRLLKVAAHVTISVRRVYVRFCSAFPLQELFRLCQGRLELFASG